MRDETPARVTPQAVLGGAIAVAGLLLTAANFDWIDARAVWRYFWPAALAALGLSIIRRAADTGARLTGLLLVLVGGGLAASHFAGWRIQLWRLWPLWLVVVGLAILARAIGRGRDPVATGDQQISDVAVWSGVQRRVSSPAFRRGDITAVMGGVELDLRGASTGGEEAVLDVVIVMGGLEIRVPPDWTVSNQVVAIFGGADDKTSGAQDSRNRLRIRGFVLMGGIEVKS